MSEVRVRIAPSPTGDPHVGTAYIGLFNYAFAKKNGGKFILRIEDTDQSRCTPQSEQAIFDALRWVGLSWDEGPDVGGDRGPYRQSERLDIYKRYADALIATGHAYKCTCTPERLAQLREEQKAAKQNFGYDGRCRHRDAADVQKEIDDGATFVVRLAVPEDGETTFTDLLRGDVTIQNSEIDDQVLVKGDGFPTYHLANVADDHEMGITHVIRGEEWITSTPKHVLLYRFLAESIPQMKMPVFAHLPLLRNADKSKVSKRKNPVSISYFREAGYLPEAFCNFIGHMAFTFADERDIFSLDEFVEEFDLERVSLGGPVFDLKKLLWLNGRYLREKRSDADWLAYLREQLFSDAYLQQIIPLVKPRVEKAEDFISYAPYFFTASVGFEEGGALDPQLLVIKGRKKKEITKLYEAMVEEIDRLYDFTGENIEATMRAFCEANDLKAKELFMPIRFMVTGKKATPSLFDVMAVLGRERCRTRIRQAITAFKKANIKI